jgi:hypothetical protein
MREGVLCADCSKENIISELANQHYFSNIQMCVSDGIADATHVLGRRPLLTRKSSSLK